MTAVAEVGKNDLEEKSKVVVVLKNGQTTGQMIEYNSYEDLIRKCSQIFEVSASKLFDSKGGTITKDDIILNHSIVYVSAGENFINTRKGKLKIEVPDDDCDIKEILRDKYRAQFVRILYELGEGTKATPDTKKTESATPFSSLTEEKCGDLLKNLDPEQKGDLLIKYLCKMHDSMARRAETDNEYLRDKVTELQEVVRVLEKLNDVAFIKQWLPDPLTYPLLKDKLVVQALGTTT
ncbi:uncharacterized protein LOC135833385 [Planococcus citri]|uniref:uncharacterized protein LOC135833385 n=1 Tax=Planococcus citri TaxID=170843 RepID=UPI0031F84B09